MAPGEEYKISTGGPAVAEKLIVGGCRYHSGYYVCRRHPAELRISSNAGGDGLGYYGTGKEGERIREASCLLVFLTKCI